jgi:hypothetical protein
VAVKIKSSGYFEVEYKDFDGGLNVQQPETEIPDTATPAANNFQTRNKELRSRPAFTLKFLGMDPINPALGIFSFLDVNSVQHTVAWNTRGLWQLAPSGLPPGALTPWFQLGGPNLVVGNPVAYRAFANVLYYCNGGTFLASWDGISLNPTSSNAGVAGSTSIAAISVADSPTVIPGSTGPLSIGGLFLSELDNHIILANVSVLDNGTGTIYSFPNRIWWSQNGVPTQWDPTANVNAGENDFLDVPDNITAIGTTGVSGYIFRSNGITFFDPTGQGAAPFQFDHLWASEHGIGNVFPWSVAFYGPIGMFIAAENIYKLGVADFEPIGGTARDAIMADLALASGVPTAQIVPTENLGYIFTTYRISIPLNTFTRVYLYDVEKKHWHPPWDTPNLIQTAKCEEVWTGVLANLPIGAQPPGTAIQGGQPGGGAGGGGGSSGGGSGFGGGAGGRPTL